MGNSEGLYALRRGSISTLQRGSTYFLQGLSPQRVHSKGILSPKSSHKCYFSTIHPLAMTGQTPLFHADPTSARHLQNPGGATSSLPVQRRIGQRGRCPSRCSGESGSGDAAPPSTAAKRPMTERETPHEDFKTPHDQTANAPCPKQNAA